MTASADFTIGTASALHVPAIARLAGRELPRHAEVSMHGWKRRLGAGQVWQDGVMVVATRGMEVVGVAWAQPYMLDTRAVPLPWWRLDVLAVKKDAQRQGVGAALLAEVVRRGCNAGVTSVYGSCPTFRADWFTKRGFHVRDAGESLPSNVMIGGRHYDVPGRPGECLFAVDVLAESGPRLFATVLQSQPAFR
jgi:predicted N-acetyltransferase YhbS